MHVTASEYATVLVVPTESNGVDRFGNPDSACQIVPHRMASGCNTLGRPWRKAAALTPWDQPYTTNSYQGHAQVGSRGDSADPRASIHTDLALRIDKNLLESVHMRKQQLDKSQKWQGGQNTEELHQLKPTGSV